MGASGRISVIFRSPGRLPLQWQKLDFSVFGRIFGGSNGVFGAICPVKVPESYGISRVSRFGSIGDVAEKFMESFRASAAMLTVTR